MKRLADNIRRVGIVANPEKPGGRELIRKAVKLIQAGGREACTDVGTRSLVRPEIQRFSGIAELARHCDMLLVLGGDGTMLRVACEAAGTDTPILGINLGTLGFLTAAPARRLSRALEMVWSGQCVIEARPLIEAKGESKSGPVLELALNDFVISHGMVPRLIELELKVDAEVLTCYRGDGLIVSSPTGSTAYSLAAGGAVVSPQADVFALTPICPHTLSNRSVIVNLNSVVEVRLLSERVETFLAADGQTKAELRSGNPMEFRRSRYSASLVRLPGSSFFETLRRKMSWSGTPISSG